MCYQYWPSSGSQILGEFTVELLREERQQGFVLRILSVQHSKVTTHTCFTETQHHLVSIYFSQSGSSQEVSQFHITNWAPDGSCSSLKTVIDVIEEVSKVQRRTGNQPIVMHCR